ncbi:hypothetical protein FVE85_2747 [Porphyridium purpureum]|uniref:Uncharacterized protein n=1 Tax=Porphyridium purpureum TaxID=35688 RepID=A0A5J4YT43_PORPP|nr:hypothetical protein FVE85_2747 [Porphyridium purpureum]|eukprot:POR2999..scf227_4
MAAFVSVVGRGCGVCGGALDTPSGVSVCRERLWVKRPRVAVVAGANACRSRLMRAQQRDDAEPASLKTKVNLLDYTQVLDALKDVQVKPCGAALDDQDEASKLDWSISLASLLNTAGRRTYLCMFTHFGDLTTFEYAQRLLPELQVLEDKNVNLVCVGIGSPENARLFAQITGFPIEYVYADETAAAYEALDLYKGFLGERAQVHPYVKLFAMLAGIGSPGTLRRVLGGYIGSRDRSIEKWSKGAIKFLDANMFDVLGSQYQRPFELATVRLQNMIDIIPRWFELSPEKQELIVRQGATLVLDAAEERVLYAYRDTGILVYADVDHALSLACQPARLAEAGM